MRSLPAQPNPLIHPDVSPQYEELLLSRRLGRTDLSVRPSRVGATNATKPENLGTFEYAHLKAPLPKNLKDSEIFAFSPPTKVPETYFLMRRSKDGYVSATGMFKIAFPWAKHSEEKKEREYLKSKEETSGDDVAGNVWVSPSLALELAEEYNMLLWVRALLDPTEISQSPKKSDVKIPPPPKFELPPIDSSAFAPPPSIARTRARRSASPTKIASPSKSTATPRRGRQSRAQKEASAASSLAADASLQKSLDEAAERGSESQEPEEVAESNDEARDEVEAEPEPRETRTRKSKGKAQVVVEPSSGSAKEEIISTIETADDVSVTLPEVPSAEDTRDMIEKAKAMVEAANQLSDAAADEPSKENLAKKRKSEKLTEGDEEKNPEEAAPVQPTKRARLLEDKLRRERVRNRALVGVTATLAFAAAIPYFF